MRRSVAFLLLLLVHDKVFRVEPVSGSDSDNLPQELKEIDFDDGSFADEDEVLTTVPPATPDEGTGVATDDGEVLFSKTSRKSVNLARLLDFYNTDILVNNWDKLKGALTANCQQHMKIYVEGLETSQKWALKMDDASGRYNTGWFWGNQFWTGSQKHCENIAPNKDHSIFSMEQIRNNSIKRTYRDAAVSKNVKSFIDVAPGGHGQSHNNTESPFAVTFFMLRIALNTTVVAEERDVLVGLCLPYACSNNDVKNLMEMASNLTPGVTLNVAAVRSRHQYYHLYQDSTFILLVGVTTIVIILLAIGTSYDLYLHRDKQRSRRNQLEAGPLRQDMSNGDMCGSMNNNNNNNISSSDKMSGLYMINGNNSSEEFVIKSPKKENELGVFQQILLAFSIKANLNTICDRSVGSDTIPIIHGLRSISMAWVILGHTCLIYYKFSDNMEYRRVIQMEVAFQTILNSTYSVDTFFCISGLLVSFLYFRTNAKGNLNKLTQGSKGFIGGTLQFIGLLCYRFARLTAPYLFTIGFVEVGMKWFNSNSIFEPPAADHINCPNYWWRNILYINTLFPVEEMCMLWSWYLSDDSQFYVLGAIILIFSTSHFKSAASVLGLLALSSWITTAYIAFMNNHMPSAEDPLAAFDKIYDKPWTRLGPYLIGMSVGWVLFKTNCRIRIPKFVVFLGWTLSMALLLTLVYGVNSFSMSPITGAIFSAVSHSLWALGLAWIVIACTTGYGGYVNSLLSATILYPFSRVTYCAYLLHPMVLRMSVMLMDSPLHLGKELTFIIYLGQLVLSYGASFMVSLAFEAPVVSLLRIIGKVAKESP